MRHINIVFDGMPEGPDGPRFVELEDEEGRSLGAGQWIRRADGLCELRVRFTGDIVPFDHRVADVKEGAA